MDQLWDEYQKNPGNVEEIDWIFYNNKVRYNGETGKFTVYDLAYVPGEKNYIRVRNLEDRKGRVKIHFLDKG